MASGEADWDNLPTLAAYLILDKLYESEIEVIHRIRFGAVSKRWHIIAKEYKEDNKKKLPMLMVPATNNDNKRRFYSILEGKIYPKSHLAPAVPNEICIGSCFGGWLAFANQETRIITLMNPFKKVDPIELPPLEFDLDDYSGSDFTIKKVILSTDPLMSPNTYVVLTIYGSHDRLALFKSGQNKWGKIHLENWCLFSDILLYKNICYAVTKFSDIICFDLNSIDDDYDKLEVNVVNFNESRSFSPRVYLVESSKGELFMVHRDFVDDKSKCSKVRVTKSIKVYKLVLDQTSGTLIESVDMTNLDGDTVFVGFNYSWSVSASEFPMCKSNSVYFTNDFFQLYNCVYGPSDWGVYDMDDHSFGEHYKFQAPDGLFNPSKFLFNPVWILPPV